MRVTGSIQSVHEYHISWHVFYMCTHVVMGDQIVADETAFSNLYPISCLSNYCCTYMVHVLIFYMIELLKASGFEQGHIV